MINILPDSATLAAGFVVSSSSTVHLSIRHKLSFRL